MRTPPTTALSTFFGPVPPELSVFRSPGLTI